MTLIGETRRRAGKVLVRITTILLLCGPNGAIQAQGTQRVTLDDLLSLKESSYPQQLSPNGGMVVYWLDGDLWVVATQPKSIPRKVASGYLPSWSPDSQKVAYYSDASGTFQLWVFDLATGGTQQVTDLAGGIDPDPLTGGLSLSASSALHDSWSPDGRKIAFASQVIVNEPRSRDSDSVQEAIPSQSDRGRPLVLSATTPAEWTLSGIFAKAFSGVRYGAFWEEEKGTNPAKDLQLRQRTNQLFVADIYSKDIRQLTKDDSVYAFPDWSPDGEKIVCVSREGRDWIAGITNVYVIDVATGNKRAITTGSSSSKGAPSWSPDGKYIAYEERIGYRQARVVGVPSDGGHPLDLTTRLDRFVQEYLWSPDSKSIVVGYVDAPSVLSIARIELSTGVVKRVTREETANRFITISRSGLLAWQQSGACRSWGIVILPPGAVDPYVLVDFNPQVGEWDLGKQELVRWKNHAGQDMEGILIKPVGYERGRRYPLILDAYPLQNFDFKGSPMLGNQAWAARGYAVFMPISRAPHFYFGFIKSQSYTQAAEGPKGWDVTVDDVMSGVDKIVQEGIVDPNKMCLYGFSNGAGTVDYLVSATNRFKCAVSVSPALSDWLRPILMHTGYGPMYESSMGGRLLWDNPTAYLRSSAVFRVNKVKTPMLLAVGDDDGDPLLDTIEMYNGLRQFEQDVTLLRYPDQGHGFSGAALKDFWERENAFFDQHLVGKKEAN